ncbi:hypothetical protein PpBr36_04082 [Pyricularia pennisetigena]|uniref:hypothetical protein n=1 Tax=Pyricularia pennisetigena TaxID=1578925 RepID=UPI00114F8840|nr:hypothetical protein PpBr36_04082 [Pyricularia pennisetigena]TLS27024.1 hypothetical protein PpBr36_04082 [Pyricularia pennisetigena]
MSTGLAVRKFSRSPRALLTAFLVSGLNGIENNEAYRIETVAKLGLGAHIYTIPDDRVRLILKMTIWLTIPTFNLTTALAKSSILVYFLKFTMSKPCIGFIYGTLVTVVLYCIMAAVSIMACANKEASSQARQVANTVFAVAAFFNTVTDLVILLLPLWLVRPLQMPFKRKVGVGLVLMAGGFVVGVSIQRVTVALNLPNADDIIFRGGISALWGCVEIWSGITCACLPTLKPFIGYIMGPKNSPRRYTPPPSEQTRLDKSNRMSGRPQSGDPWALSTGQTRNSMAVLEPPEQAWIASNLRRGMGSACTCTAEKGKRQLEPDQMC